MTPGAGYVSYHEYGGLPEIGKTVGVSREEFDRLAFKVLALGGANFATWSMPCHDPPVAWKEPGPGILPIVVCPSLRVQWFLAPSAHPLPDAVILDEKPGRR